MPKIRHPNQNPPGGWRFLQKETMAVIQGESSGDLIQRVIKHRLHKGLSPVDADAVWDEIQRQICTRLGIHECKSEGPGDPWVPIKNGFDILELDKIKAFSAAFWEWLKSGRELVSEAEAQRRREICKVCPCNQSFSGCKACTVLGLIEAAVPKGKRFDDLEGCLVCACTLKAKVWMPESVIMAADSGRNLRFPVPCWQGEIQERHKSLQ
jgi:hypothetical protein